MKNITLADFQQEVLQSKTPVFVDVYADTCGPCKGLAQVLDQIALARGAALKIVKVNATTEGALAAQLRARTVPTLILFQHGQVVGQRSGALPRPELEKWLDEKLVATA